MTNANCLKKINFLFLAFSLIFAAAYHARAQSGSFTFVRLNSYIGYVIDARENALCRCVNFAGKDYSYGSLVQLPDSNVVFRVRINGRDNFVNIPFTAEDIVKLSANAAYVQRNVNGGIDEEEVMKKMAGDSATINRIDYYQLKYKSAVVTQEQILVLEDTSYNYTFGNLGIGLTTRAGKESYFSFGLEAGRVFNRNIISGRIGYHRVPGSILGNVTPKERITEFGILYGRVFPADKIFFTVSTGIAYSTGVLKGKLLDASGFIYSTSATYEEDDFNEFGIPVKVEMLAGNARKSLASIAVLVNMNARYFYYGILISFRMSDENRPLK